MKDLYINLNNNFINIKTDDFFYNDIKNILFSNLIKPIFQSKFTSDFYLTKRKHNFAINDFENEIFKSNKPEEILYTLEWKTVDRLIAKHNNYFQFRGAALSFQNNGYVFIGNPGTGKTSLSIVLMNKNFNFLSDEISLINPLTFNQAPFPRNLIIKPHLQQDVDIPKDYFPLSIDTDDDKKENAFFLSPNLFGKTVHNKSIYLKKIFFLNLSTDPDFKINKIGNHEAFNLLLPQLFNADKFLNTPELIINMLQKIPCYNLHLSKPLLFNKLQIENLIKQLIN